MRGHRWALVASEIYVFYTSADRLSGAGPLWWGESRLALERHVVDVRVACLGRVAREVWSVQVRAGQVAAVVELGHGLYLNGHIAED
jgi:hypothetical protein